MRTKPVTLGVRKHKLLSPKPARIVVKDGTLVCRKTGQPVKLHGLEGAAVYVVKESQYKALSGDAWLARNWTC